LYKQWLRDCADYALQKKIPIFVSECADMESLGWQNEDLKAWGKIVKQVLNQ
jgi:hypothetical protein